MASFVRGAAFGFGCTSAIIAMVLAYNWYEERPVEARSWPDINLEQIGLKVLLPRIGRQLTVEQLLPALRGLP
jgi:hypothetical protein